MVENIHVHILKCRTSLVKEFIRITQSCMFVLGTRTGPNPKKIQSMWRPWKCRFHTKLLVLFDSQQNNWCSWPFSLGESNGRAPMLPWENRVFARRSNSRAIIISDRAISFKCVDFNALLWGFMSLSWRRTYVNLHFRVRAIQWCHQIGSKLPRKVSFRPIKI